MKLVTKVRQGSRLLRRYDTPQTPFQRVLACQQVEHAEGTRLHRTLQTTDPFELSRRIDQQLERVTALAGSGKGLPRTQPPGSSWKGWTFSKKLKQQQREMIAQERGGMG